MNTVLTLLNPQEAARHYASGAWRRDTFYSLLKKHAAERAQRYALRDGRTRLTWKELLAWVDALAQAWHAAGVRRGERIGVWLPSRAESVVALLACARNGYVCMPSLHQNYTAAEIVQFLERTRAAALVMQSGYGAAGVALPAMKVVFDVRGGSFPAPGAACEVPAVDDPDKIAYLAFTSGTTGVPKGVMHSDNTLLANGRAMVADWRHDHSTVLLSLSPMSHHIGTVAIEQMMAAGFELVVNDPPAGMRPLDWALECGATYVMGVPTHAMDVLAQQKARGAAKLGRVAVFYMAGSPIPPSVAAAFVAQGLKPHATPSTVTAATSTTRARSSGSPRTVVRASPSADTAMIPTTTAPTPSNAASQASPPCRTYSAPRSSVSRKEGRMNARPTAAAPLSRECSQPMQKATCAASGPGASWESARLRSKAAVLSQPRRSTRSRRIAPTSAIGPPKPRLPSRRK